MSTSTLLVTNFCLVSTTSKLPTTFLSNGKQKEGYYRKSKKVKITRTKNGEKQSTIFVARTYVASREVKIC